MRKLAVLVVVALAFAGCGSPGEEDAPTPSAVETADASGDITFGKGRALIDTDEGSIFVDIEVAETDRQRVVGLSRRESLPEDAGMLFFFFQQHSGGFTMKDTTIPLSIAFIDDEGAIVEILDMEPCAADPCPSYDPGSPYRAALEVNQGAFEEWGVEVGDLVTVTRKSS